MNITTRLAKFAANFFALPTTDDKVYGIKNGDFFEVPAGGDDGMTKANFITNLLNGTTLVDTWAPKYYKKNVGVGQLIQYGFQAGSSPEQYGAPVGAYSFSNTGSGSLVSFGLGSTACITGTTATGNAGFRLGLFTADSSNSYDLYNQIISNTAHPVDYCTSFTFFLSALSDATNTYIAKLSVLGGPIAVNTGVPSVNDAGVAITYTHSVNSGNFVLHYRDNTGTLKSVNTTKAPSVSLATPNRIIAVAKRLTNTTATITITIDGTDYIITDASLTANAIYTSASLSMGIYKSAGTTSRTANMRSALLGRTL